MPCPINGLIYGFAGSDTHNLTTVHIPSAAFESSGPYNILNDATTISASLETLPQDQLYHCYIVAGTLDMTTSTCKHTIILPTHWYAELCEHFLDRIKIKTFRIKYDRLT